LDKFGPRSTTIAGAIVFLLGNLLFGAQLVNNGELIVWIKAASRI